MGRLFVFLILLRSGCEKSPFSRCLSQKEAPSRTWRPRTSWASWGCGRRRGVFVYAQKSVCRVKTRGTRRSAAGVPVRGSARLRSPRPRPDTPTAVSWDRWRTGCRLREIALFRPG